MSHTQTYTHRRARARTHTHTHGQVLESMDWSISFNVLVMEQTKCHAQIEALLTTKGYEYIREQRGNAIWAHRNFTPRATAAATGGSVKAQNGATSLGPSGSAHFRQESRGPRPQMRLEKPGGVSMAAAVVCIAVVGGGAVLVCFKTRIFQNGCWTGHRRLGVGQVISSTHRRLTKLYTLSRRVLTCMCTSAVGQVVCTHLRGQHIHAGRPIFRF